MKAQSVFGESKQVEDTRPDILLLHAKNKCLDCGHALFLHFQYKCGMCTCVRRPRRGNWTPKNKAKVYQALVEAAKYYPKGIELSQLIYVTGRHNREVFAYFQIAKFGRRVTYVSGRGPYSRFDNSPFLTFRRMLISGKIPDLKIIAMIPQFTVGYSGEGLI